MKNILMTMKNQTENPSGSNTVREEKLAKALRENLLKRKKNQKKQTDSSVSKAGKEGK